MIKPATGNGIKMVSCGIDGLLETGVRARARGRWRSYRDASGSGPQTSLSRRTSTTSVTSGGMSWSTAGVIGHSAPHPEYGAIAAGLTGAITKALAGKGSDCRPEMGSAATPLAKQRNTARIPDVTIRCGEHPRVLFEVISPSEVRNWRGRDRKRRDLQQIEGVAEIVELFQDDYAAHIYRLMPGDPAAWTFEAAGGADASIRLASVDLELALAEIYAFPPSRAGRGMKRRHLLAGAASALAAPAVRAQPAKVIKFVPQADLAVLAPIWTTATVTRNHGYLVFGTLYGMDAQYRIQPQMVEGPRRLQGRARGHAGRHRRAGDRRPLRGGRRHVPPHRLQPGLPDLRLGHRGAAPHLDGARRSGRLEHPSIRLRPAGHCEPRRQARDSRQRQAGLGRLADLAAAGGASRRLVRAPDLPAQKRICGEMQFQVWQDVPYIPLGLIRRATAYRADLRDMPEGGVLFTGARRA